VWKLPPVAYPSIMPDSWKTFLDIRTIWKVTLSSSSLWACFHSLSPLSVVSAKWGNFIKPLTMKCWNSAFNAQGSRVIIVVLQTVKIYVAAVEALSKMERQDETQFTTKIGGKISLGLNYFVSENFHSQLHVRSLLCWNWLFSPP